MLIWLLVLLNQHSTVIFKMYLPKATSAKSSHFFLCYWRCFWYFGYRRKRIVPQHFPLQWALTKPFTAAKSSKAIIDSRVVQQKAATVRRSRAKKRPSLHLVKPCRSLPSLKQLNFFQNGNNGKLYRDQKNKPRYIILSISIINKNVF